MAQRELIHSGVRQYMHRMIICLGDELLKYVPMAISLMLKDCTVSRMYEIFMPVSEMTLFVLVSRFAGYHPSY